MKDYRLPGRTRVKPEDAHPARVDGRDLAARGLANRVEAIKSLYSAGDDSELQKTMIWEAERQSWVLVRHAAILFLSKARDNSKAQDLLERIVERDWHDGLRAAALLARTDPDGAQIRDFFHLPYRTEPFGERVDPIDSQ